MGMKHVGTLKELDVKPGDVVEWPGICKYVVQDDGVTVVSTETGRELKDGINYYGAKFRIISRASENQKLWRDMTPEEKGALLLAHHEGKVIENKGKWNDWLAVTPAWADDYAYRIKPEPKIEVAEIEFDCDGNITTQACSELINHRITFNTIDGEPDCASIKMEKL